MEVSVCEDNELEDDLPAEESLAPGESFGEEVSLIAEESAFLAADVSVGGDEDTAAGSLGTGDSAEDAPLDSSVIPPSTAVSVLRILSPCVPALLP